ncbi:MAG: hypothetical protein IKG23_00395 [Clostridia bacterium]|nr:hypothetical protein [Clostridia bacterium]
MAEGIEVARAIVTIVPSMEGSQREMTNQLTSAGEEAGEKAGKQSGSKFTGGFGSAVKKGAKVMATAVTAAVAGTGALVKGIYDAASATAAYGDNIDKMSQKIGLSTDAYQEWDFIAQHSGTSMESLKTSMVKLSTAAANGSDAFQKLGISAEDAQSMSREELWNKTVMALTSVEDETERARIAQELFGKGATEMGALLNTSAADIEAMRQQAHDLGIVMSEEDVKASAAFQDSLQNMTQSFDGLKNRMLAEFLPGITTVMDGLTQIFAGDSAKGVGLIKEGISKISERIKEVLPTLIETGGEILKAILGAISDSLPTIVPLASDILTTLGGAIVTALPTLFTAGADIIVNLVGSIIEHAPELAEGAIKAVGALTEGIADLFPTIITKGGEMITKLVEGISGQTEDGSTLFTTIGEALQKIVGKLGEILPQVFEKGGEIIGQLVNAIGNEESGLPNILKSFGDFGTKVIAALDEHAPGIAEAIKTVMSGFEPFIPAIENMVSTVAEKLPDIINSFNGIVSQISPIIDSITGLIKQIGSTVVSIVDSVGKNLGLIVDAFSGFNESLASPIEAIGNAISGIITSISDGVVSINDSIANILEKLSGVFDSIGNAAVKAGEGFSTVADAAIKLANQTSVFDLIATLGGIARGIGDITNKANDMANKKIAEKLETLGPALKAVTDGATGLDISAANISSLAVSVNELNTETKDQNIVNNLDRITLAIEGLSAQASLSGTELHTFVTNADKDFSKFSSSTEKTLSGMEKTFKGKNYNFKYYMKDAIDNINLLNLNPLEKSISDSLSRIGSLFANIRWTIPYIRTPHFYWSGVWDMDGSDGYMSAPSLNVSWYDKGGVFTEPTVIGVAEKRPEFVGALDDLRDIVREEAGPKDVVINVYGAEGQDVRTLADIVMERIQHSIDRREAVFA